MSEFSTITEDEISLQRDNLYSTDPERQLSATVFFRTLISGKSYFKMIIKIVIIEFCDFFFY